MAPNCSIPSCPSKYCKKLSLFGYPIKYPKILEKWKCQIKENFPDFTLDDIKTAKVCQFHFEDKYIVQTGKERRYLSFDAVPTLFGLDNAKNVKDLLPRRIANRQRSRDLIMHVKLQSKKPSIDQYRHRCRFCLKRLNANETEFIEDSFRNSLESTMNVHINPSTVYPRFMCKQCFKNLEKFENFRLKILESQETLSKVFENVTESAVSVPIIKEEPIDIESDYLEEFLEEEEESCELDNPEKLQDEIDMDIETKNCILKIEPEEPKVVEQNLFKDIPTETGPSRTQIYDDTGNERNGEVIQKIKFAKEDFRQFQYQKVPCNFCGKKIVRALLKTHIAAFHEQKQFLYECDICGAKFCMQGSLEKHVESHKTEKKFECKFCGTLFNSSNTRSIHMIKAHIKSDNTDCEFCGKSMYNKKHLVKHILLTHTKDRSIVCDLPGCGKAFLSVKHKHKHFRRKVTTK